MIDHARMAAMQQAKIVRRIGQICQRQHCVAADPRPRAAGMGMTIRPVRCDKRLDHLRYVACHQACCCFVHRQPLRGRQRHCGRFAHYRGAR
jgi:hypothetical protein